MTRQRKAWQVLDKAGSFGLRAGENLVFHNVHQKWNMWER